MHQYTTMRGVTFPRRSIACSLAVAGATFGLLAAACGGADRTAPVATVSLSTSAARAPLGSPIELRYRFDLAPDAKIAGDYKVFAHVMADGQMLWSDDHDPPVPTSEWKPGQTIAYARTRFVPVVPYVGEATISVGLYSGDDRLPLQGGDNTEREIATRAYRVGAIDLRPSSENIFLIFKSGWHPTEFSPDPSVSWQWTQKSAVLSFKNPRADALLYLDFDARPELFPGQPQQVVVSLGGQEIARFPADSAAQVLKTIPLAAAQLGQADMAEVSIDVDRTFVPANLPSGGRDLRELGIRVYHAFVASR